MTDSNNDSNKEISADDKQDKDAVQQNTFVDTISIPEVLDKAGKMMTSYQKNSNEHTIEQLKINAGIIEKFYTRLFVFAFCIIVIGSATVFWGDKSIGENIIFTTIGLVGGFIGGFGAGLVSHKQN